MLSLIQGTSIIYDMVPVHVTPSPVYTDMHVQRNDPCVLVQLAFI